MENQYMKHNQNVENYPLKKKIDFKCYPKNTIKSLIEVEHFLNNFHYYFKYFKLYKLLK